MKQNHVAAVSKKLLFVLVTGAFIAPQFVVAVESATLAKDTGVAALNDVKDALKKAPNFIQYAEYKMLKYKYTTSTQPYSYDYDEYSLKPRGESPLSIERTGGYMGAFYNDVGPDLNVLTGGRAIDESLQLGSIGTDRGAQLTSPEQRTIENALQSYYWDNKSTYPARLDELVPKYMTSVPKGFIYVLTFNKYGRSDNTRGTYTLKIDPQAQAPLTIDDVKPLELKSHPWAKMQKSPAPTVPKIFSYIPADDFVVYFSDTSKFSELEKAFDALNKPLGAVYKLGNARSLEAQVLRRLQIKDDVVLSDVADELAFVSYDFDFFPNTDYALIVKVKSSQKDAWNNYTKSVSNGLKGTVGDFSFVTTDMAIYEEIKNLASGPKGSLAQAPDLTYALSVLEPDYDGITYISEGLVQKLTSPEYRIAARRRNTILHALETLQYTVFAYRDLTGRWPANIEDMVTNHYIAPGSVASSSDYSVDKDGFVRHKDWGTLYDTVPIDRVPVTSILPAEKILYEQFAKGYQDYWREYIDPVGIALTIGDQIRLHTIILPLIEESRYSFIRDAFGGKPVKLSFVENPTRIPSVQIAAKFDIENLIYSQYSSRGYYENEEYQNCVRDYYSHPAQTSTPLSSCDRFKITDRGKVIASVKKDLAKAIDWDEKDGDVLGFMGNEVLLAAGEVTDYKLSDISSLDFYLGIAVKDQALAKKFLDKVYAKIAKEFVGSRGGGNLFDLFSVNLDQPVKNTYRGVDFYLIPTGFTNIYYTFHDNRFYATLSQKAMNALIDGMTGNTSASEPKEWSAPVLRLFDYLGPEHNIVATADATRLQEWIKGLTKASWDSYLAQTELGRAKSHLAEATVLAKTLPGYDGTLTAVAAYYRHLPERWYDARFSVKNGIPYATVGGTDFNLNNLESSYSSYYYYRDSGSSEKKPEDIVKATDITKKFSADAALKDWEAFKDFGVGFTINKDGLDIKLAVNNPVNENVDSRIARLDHLGTRTGFPVSLPIVAGAGGGAVVLIVIVSALVMRKRKLASLAAASGNINYPSASGTARPSTSADRFFEPKRPPAPAPQPILVPPDLVAYVSQARSQGVSNDDIRKALLANQWPEDTVNAALR